MGCVLIPEAGNTYGKWTVLREDPKSKRTSVRWFCRCECGIERSVPGNRLRHGGSKGCIKCRSGREPLTETMAETIARNSSKADINGCINWTGGTHSQGGYSVVLDRTVGKVKSGHVVAWELVNGPVPSGKAPDGSRWELHHTCKNKICVNPDHLELVSSREHHSLDAPTTGSWWDRVYTPYKDCRGFLWHKNPICRNGIWGVSFEL